MQGFFYFFGLTSNPLQHISSSYKYQSSVEALNADWKKVGHDLKNAFDEQTAKTKPTA